MVENNSSFTPIPLSTSVHFIPFKNFSIWKTRKRKLELFYSFTSAYLRDGNIAITTAKIQSNHIFSSISHSFSGTDILHNLY